MTFYLPNARQKLTSSNTSKHGDVMTAVIVEAKHKLARNFNHVNPSSVGPILADPWVVSSLLQKSIRRGDAEIAQKAAHTLFKLKGSAIWRRFIVIAFEDIGVGSPDALLMTVAAGADPSWRKQCGGDAHVAMTLARIMAEMAKDRSSDYLVGAGDHPSLVGTDALCGINRKALRRLGSNAIFLSQG
jgi:hypothetical protein